MTLAWCTALDMFNDKVRNRSNLESTCVLNARVLRLSHSCQWKGGIGMLIEMDMKRDDVLWSYTLSPHWPFSLMIRYARLCSKLNMHHKRNSKTWESLSLWSSVSWWKAVDKVTRVPISWDTMCQKLLVSQAYRPLVTSLVTLTVFNTMSTYSVVVPFQYS